MKNFEKYIDKLSKQICVRTITREKGNKCEECTFGLSDGSCNDEMIKQWLLEEYKEPCLLSHDEYVILKNLPNKWEFIARDCSNKVILFYGSKPKKEKDWWIARNGKWSFFKYSHLFKFIKFEDEEPYEIAKLIADYEKEHPSD